MKTWSKAAAGALVLAIGGSMPLSAENAPIEIVSLMELSGVGATAGTESFMMKVEDGRQVVFATMPALGAK
jgi:hypothetical protein